MPPSKRKSGGGDSGGAAKAARPPAIKRGLSSASVASDASQSTDVPSAAALRLPHVQMFTDW